MSTLQKVNLGTPPTAVDGDTVRGANTKSNANVDVLNTQLAIVSSAATITTPQALTVAHVGKRVNVNLASAGVINLPSAATCAADQVILLRNLGSTVATLSAASGSGDTVTLSRLQPRESALMDTDGVHAWTVLMRGRADTDNEIVTGNCTVNGNETVAGQSTLIGGASFGTSGQASISSAGVYSGLAAAYTGTVSANSGFSVPNNVGYRATSTVGNAVSVMYIDSSNNVCVGNITVPLVLIGNAIKDQGGNAVLTSASGAALAGAAGQPFSVGTASSAAHAVRYDQAYGVGQSIVDVTPSRAYNVTYTNSTGKGIYVYITGTSPGGGGAYGLFISGQEVALATITSAGGPLCVSAFVPPGATYQLSTSGSVSGSVVWREYR